MKNLNTFEEFLNEYDSRFVSVDTTEAYDKYKDSLTYKSKFGEWNLYPKGTPPDWMKTLHTEWKDIDGPKSLISDVSVEWEKQKRGKFDRSLEKSTEKIAKQFFDKKGYINGNIIYSIIDQNHK
jgi:hypothetical protein